MDCNRYNETALPAMTSLHHRLNNTKECDDDREAKNENSSSNVFIQPFQTCPPKGIVYPNFTSTYQDVSFSSADLEPPQLSSTVSWGLPEESPALSKNDSLGRQFYNIMMNQMIEVLRS